MDHERPSSGDTDPVQWGKIALVFSLLPLFLFVAIGGRDQVYDLCVGLSCGLLAPTFAVLVGSYSVAATRSITGALGAVFGICWLSFGLFLLLHYR